MKIQIPFIILIIALIVLSNILIVRHIIIPAQVSVSLSGIISLTAIILAIRKMKKINIEKNDLCRITSELYTSSNNLLNMFCSFFDNNFYFINILINKEKDIKAALENISLLNDNFTMYKENIMTENEKICTDNKIDINKKIETHIKECTEFTHLMSTLEKGIFENMKARINDTYDKKEDYHRLIVQYQLYSEIIFSLTNSIRTNIEGTSKPLSEEILIISQKIYDFISNIDDWKKGLSDENSSKNFNSVIKRYNVQNEEFQYLFEKINKNYIDLEKKFTMIFSMIEKVYENSFQIQNISEKIKILSINASIESARAEKYGKGFKVIAEEIKKLSDDTKIFISSIVSMISDSKQIISNTVDDFKKTSSEITTRINFQKTEFDSFYTILESYYDDFNHIFSSVTSLTNEVAMHIDKFSPIFQFHDISIQELGNLNKMVLKFIDDNKEEVNKINSITDINMKNNILVDLLSYIEKIITTSSEIEVINNIYKEHNVDRIIIDNKNIEIEIF
jgi:methyl-accepting chemotaxis protein